MSKPWEQDWSADSADTGAKPWERDFETDAAAVKPAKKQSFVDDIAEFGLDMGKRAAGAVVSGVASIPLGIEKGVKSLVRSSVEASGDSMVPAGIYNPGIDTDESIHGPETARDKDARFLAAERAASGIPSLPGARTLAKAGQQGREAIHATTSEATRQAVADSQITGNILKGEIDFGKDPSVRGFVMQASDVFGSMLPVVVGSLVTRSPNVGGAIGGAMAAGEGADSAERFISGKSDDELMAQSPFFARLVNGGASYEEARRLTLDKASESAALLQGAVASVGDRFTGKLVTGKLDPLLTRAAGKSIAGKTAAGAALSGTEEGVQEVMEGVASDVGVASVVPTKEIGEDSAANLVLGAMGGAPAGAGRGAYTGVRDRFSGDQGVTNESQGPDGAITNEGTSPEAGQDQAPAPARIDGAAPAAVPNPGRADAPVQAAGVATAATDEAARALREPVNLTALDRADQLGAELQRLERRQMELAPENGYGPAFDTERNEIAQQAQQLKAERDAIASTWPTAIKGAPTSFSTEAGVKLDGEYALVDADDLVTSHDENLRQNPLFPAELQPRDRSRQASELQVSSIVQRLDPARLGVSADAATGAPIVGADGLVESGNARTIALKRVYQAQGQKAEDYKAWLRQSASQFGITPDAVDGMRKPVLVRVRNTPVNRAEFARQANQSTIQRMSPSEQASADARRLTSLEGLQPDDNGDFSTSYDFIRQFMATLPITEQSDMIESDGRLSTTGYRRMQNAILAKAYGDSPTLRRMTESLDNNLVNVSKALVRAAPSIAAARERVQAGSLYDADIAPDLVQAVEGLSSIKEKGWTVAQELGQTDLTGPKYSPEASELLQFLADNIRSPRRIAEFLQRYYEALEAAGDPNQGSLLGDTDAPTRGDLIQQARGTNDGKQEAAGPASQDRQQPQDAQGRGQGTGGNEGAGQDAQAGQQRAEGSQAERVTTLEAQRAEAVQDFKDALADLAAIASKHTRAAMVPESTPDLMPTLVRLFDSAIRMVGTDMKATTKWVKDQLKKDPRFKTFWNKIAPSTYNKAALQAMESQEKAPAQAGLFDDMDAATDALQGDLFAADPAPAPAPRVVTQAPVKTGTRTVVIDGIEHNLDAENFGLKPWPRNLKDGDPLLVETSTKPLDSMVMFNDFEMTRAQMHRIIIDWHFERAQPAPADRKPIAYVMGGGGASGKGTIKKLLRAQGLINDDGAVNLDPDEIKLEIPEYQQIVQAGDSRAAAVVHEESSGLSKQIKKRAMDGRYDLVLDVTLGDKGKGETYLNDLKAAGYEVRLFGVSTDPATSVVRADARARKSGRYVPIKDLLKAHKGFNGAFEAYAKIADTAMLYENTDGRQKLAEATGGQPLIAFNGYNVIAERSQLNEQATTLGTIGGNQPSVGFSDRQVGSRGTGARRADADGAAGRTGDAGQERGLPRGDQGTAAGPASGGLNATTQPGQGDTQGQDARPVQGNGQQGDAGSVRARRGRGDQQQRRDDDAAAARGAEVGQPGTDGKRKADPVSRSGAPGNGDGAVGGVPAGRDIAPKSGLNYQFGADDLTYTGSWFSKAEANIAAIEVLKRLQKDGRQATADEQKTMAKFIGWGSSELANNLFGDKLNKAAAIKESAEKALAAMDKAGKDVLKPGGYDTVGYRRQYVSGDPEFMDAFKALQTADPQITWYTHKEITREMLKRVMPDKQTLRWIEMRDRLKGLLTPEEFADASRSTQYAHYTSKAVVSSMWRAAQRMGFAGGTILEPGAGIGIFPGLMPAGIAASSSYTGIEFEPMTGGILKQLFPDERILVESFVDTKLPKNFFDVAIGNPPFSGTKILGDPEYAKRALSLHDYFFAKTIDRVKPGGLVMFVTSRYTMDKLDDKARKYLADRADLVGAIRLPQTAFKANAGTEVVTDVLFLRKKVPGETFAYAQPWLGVAEAKTADGKTLMVSGNKEGDADRPAMINEYFAAHPEMVLGQHSAEGSMRRAREYTVTPLAGDIEEHFAKAVETLPADIYTAERGSAAEAAKVREIDFNPKAQKEGNYYVTDAGVLMIREEGVGQRVQLKSAKDIELIKDFVPLRDALKQAHYDQLTDGDWEPSLRSLQTAYEKFTAKHGQINQFTTKVVKTKAVDEDTGQEYTDETTVRVFPLLQKLRDDPDYSLVAALETINDDTGEIKPSAFLTQRVLGKPEAAAINSPVDALLTVLNDVGRVDVGLIAQRVGMSEQDTIEALGSTIYQDPEAGWQTADEYLSGNVRKKLEAARAAAQADRRYERNVTALEAAQPAPKVPSQISPGLGENWIPGSDYAQFLFDLAGVKAEVQFNDATKQWIVNEISGGKSTRATADHGTDQRNATELLEHALTGRPVRITKTEGTGKDRKSVFDAAGTEAANQKLDAMREAFQAWVWNDSERTDRLVKIYNDRFNTTVSRKFDGSHLTLPGTSKAFQVFDHVKRGAWRIIQQGNTYLAHAVGSGKTFQMVIAAMEQKRLGLIKKPMVVVPNHMLKQFAHEWQLLYPAARLMVADENNFHTDNRRRFVSRVALSDLDGVIITHSAFKLLDLDGDFKRKMIEEQLEFMQAALTEAQQDDKSEGGGRKSPRVKQIEKQIENMEQKLEAAMSSEGKDKNVRFDELGVDFLMVDEAHEYRKLDFATTRQVKGISPQGSAKAFDLYMKSRYLEEKQPGRSLVMASGTVITNTLAELYTVQKFMDRQALIDRNIDDFDSWAAMFGRERTTLEPDAAGRYTPVTRFTKFVKVPALTQMFREFADVLTSDHLAALLGDKRPKVEGGSRSITVTPKTTAYAEYQKELERRVEESRAWKPSKDQPNNPDPMIRIIGDGRLAAIDMRFINPSLPSDPDSKLNRMIDDVIAKFKETADLEYRDKAGNVEPNKGASMMVFSDLGFGEGVAESRGFNARAWLEKRMRDSGVPMNQVAFMSDYKKSADKLKLFKDVNAGRVRVLVGSSKNMGTGVNAQQRLKALFHLDSPWYPADLEQREGRIVRQGNKNPLVQIFAYAAKGTYDENMWKMLASKQYFIDQAMSGDESLTEIEDLDSQSQFDLAAAMVAEDPRVLQLAGARAEIEKLQRLYQAHEDQRQRFRSQFDAASVTVEFNEKRLPEAEKAAAQAKDLTGDKFVAKVGSKAYTERAKWAEALVAEFDKLTAAQETKPRTVGEISGFPVVFGGETVAGQYVTRMVLGTPEPKFLHESYDIKPNLAGLAMRAQNAVADVARLPVKMRERITEARAQMDALRERLSAPFPMSAMLADKIKEAQAIEDAIKSDSTDKTYRVERKADGLGFDVKAVNESSAIMKAIETNGGAPEEWIAKLQAEEPLAEGDAPRLSLRSRDGNTDTLDFDRLQALAKRVKAGMPNMPRVHVLADPSKAPRALREYIIRQDAWYDVEGAMHDGELYLFASGLADEARAEHVLVEHEAAHYGLRAILGPSLKSAMRLIHAQNASVRKAATELQKRGKLSDVVATEEVIVDIPSSQLAQLRGWRKLVMTARDWMADRGYSTLAQKLTDWLDGTLTQQQRADLFVAELVRAAREYVAGKRSGRPGSILGTRLSGTLAEDIEKQEAWLQAEARSRGFKDIEDLLEKDYPLFEKLAELWRKKNPADMLLSRVKVQTDTPAFKRWFGGSKVVDAKGEPKVMYHGTTADIESFKEGTPIYLADTGAGASQYARQFGYVKTSDAGSGGNVIPLFVKAENTFDYNDAQHIDWLVKDLTDSGVIKQVPIEEDEDYMPLYDSAKEALQAGNAYAYRSPAVQTAIQKRFDSFYSVARGQRNLAVFSPAQVKSAIGNTGAFDPANPDIRMSRAAPSAGAAAKTVTERAEAIIQKKAGGSAPLDAIARAATKVTGIERLTGAIYDRAGALLQRVVPEKVKAGIVSDYGVPEAVIDQRIMLQGRQRVQLRKTGALIEKLATLTREESRVAYEWMNMDGSDPKAYLSMMQDLPEESVQVLQEVQKLIDDLSQEAVRLGQLDKDAFERNRFAYLRRSYAKHILEQTAGEKAKRSRVISILGDQYKGRGLVQAEPMAKMQAAAPDWWGLKLKAGKADTALKGQKFIRLENRAQPGAGTRALPGMDPAAPGRVSKVVYVPADQAIPQQYAGWIKADTWEVRDVKGGNVVLWRDFTKDERQQMGEVDEARFAIAKTMHAMIHDVEVGRYLEWLARNHSKAEGQTIPGVVVEASERYRDTFAPNEWVKVPDTKIPGTSVMKYGALAGHYLPGPIWNDLRQVVGGQFRPFGDAYAKILSMWKTSKTALSPAVHMNNVMSNFVMADWQDVRAVHVGKALRIILAASGKKGGIADSAAALEVLNRYKDSGGDIGSWVTQEISKEQLDPLLSELEVELAATADQAMDAQAGIYAALQHALGARFPAAWEALASGKTGKAVGNAAGALIDLYQAEDDVFRLAAWLKAKEEGADDLAAGKKARRSFLDYNINAPWVQAMRSTAWPFISFTYRAVPLLFEIAGKKPHKLMKIMMLAGGLNALGVLLGGGGDDDERKMLPEEKAGRIWGMVPKLIRMPWNDEHGSPVYLDIRRWVPVGDVFDVGAGNAAVPMFPGLMPGGPLVIAGEIVLNKSAFTGKPLTLETDTGAEKAAKVGDYLYKAFAPNIVGLPNTYATEGVVGSMTGRTDAFGRELSTPQAMASAFGVKLGSYPADVLRRNLGAKAMAEASEIDKNIGQLKRQLATGRIDRQEFDEQAAVQIEKKRKLMQEVREKLN